MPCWFDGAVPRAMNSPAREKAGPWLTARRRSLLARRGTWVLIEASAWRSVPRVPPPRPTRRPRLLGSRKGLDLESDPFRRSAKFRKDDARDARKPDGPHRHLATRCPTASSVAGAASGGWWVNLLWGVAARHWRYDGALRGCYGGDGSSSAAAGLLRGGT